MNPEAIPNPTDDAMLTGLAALEMRMAQILVRLADIEQAAAEVVAASLPRPGVEPASAAEAVAAGASLDGLAEWMAGAAPRVAMLARALERVSRSVRRDLALAKRMAAGWPRAVCADDRPAMVRRQVQRGVSEVIRRVSDSDEAAERLFNDLRERLDDPWMDQAILEEPVAEIVRRVCRELGLAAGAPRQPRVTGSAAGRPSQPPHGPPFPSG